MIRKLIPLYLLILAITGCKPAVVEEEKSSESKKEPIEVAQWRGPNRNGYYPDTNLLRSWPDGGPNLLWKYDKLGVGYATVSVTDSMVHTIGTLEGINYTFAFTTTGKLLWKQKLGPEWMVNYPGSRGTPLIYDKEAYFLSGLGVMYCYNSTSGDLIWQKDLKSEYSGRHKNCGYSENLVAHDSLIFCTVGGKDTSVVALNRHTGNLIWGSKATGEKNGYGSPIIVERGGNVFYINQADSSIFSVDIKTGKMAWAYKTGSQSHPNTPIYHDGYIFAIESWSGKSYKFKLSEDGFNIDYEWYTHDLSALQGDAVLIGDRLYGSNQEEKEFSCVDWNTGYKLFRGLRKRRPLYQTVIAADSLLYLYDDDGDFFLIKPHKDRFEKMGKFRINENKKEHYSHPVIKDGKLYVRHQSTLYVYDIAEK